MTAHIITRAAWGAMPSVTRWRVIAPVSFVFLSFIRKRLFTEHEVVNDSVWKCCRGMRYLQAGDVRTNSSMGDLRYNFVIGEDGNIYEGRGFSFSPTLPRRYRMVENRAILIGLMGDFSWRSPPDCIFIAISNLIDYGISNKHINPKHLEFTI